MPSEVVSVRRKHRTRVARRSGAGVTMLAVAAGLAVTPPADARAADSPSPSPSPSALRLPVVPRQLGQGATRCTGASRTRMEASPWAQTRLVGSGLKGFADGSGVTVGIVGTGVSAEAPSLTSRVTGPARTDCVGYGTFLAGLIAAAPRPGVAFAGLAPGADIYAVRGTDGTGTPTATLTARGIRAAVDGGAGVIDVPTALPAGSDELAAATTYAREHDVVIVAPAVPDATAGTTGDAAPTAVPYWPAALDGVISVVDIDIDGQRPDGAAEPYRAELAAPGQAVTGIGPAGDGHYLGNGASVASAFVAGAAALVRDRHPELSAPQVIQRLLATSYPADVPELDVHGALTGIVPAKSPAAPRVDRSVRLPLAAQDGTAVARGLTLTAVCALLALAAGAAAALGRRLRARRAAAPPSTTPH